jgi:hypothetical protein
MTEMEKAYELAALAVRQRLAEQHPGDLVVLDQVRADDVAVFSGTYDSVQEVLRRLAVPFTLDPTEKKLQAQLVFANCSNTAAPGLPQLVEPHVRSGGWLVSTDWSLQNVVAAAFPDTVRRAQGSSSGNDVVAVEPALDSYWSEVVVLGADPQWWLESGSYPIEIVDPERVHVEAASHELLVRYRAPAVAVRFAWGRGQVYHVISHLWLKQSRVPNERYRGPCSDFLTEGMHLSDEGIARVLRRAGVAPTDLTFAAVQSAATATELVAQLCIRARHASLPAAAAVR